MNKQTNRKEVIPIGSQLHFQNLSQFQCGVTLLPLNFSMLFKLYNLLLNKIKMPDNSLSAFNNLTDLEICSIARLSYRIDRLCTVVEARISFSNCNKWCLVILNLK